MQTTEGSDESKIQWNQELLARYDIGKYLGSGTFSVVKEVTEKTTKAKWALKIVDKSLVGPHNTPFNEVNILKRVNHENVIRLKEIFESPTHLFIVIELVTGGELFDEIVHRGAFSEKDAAELVRQIVNAVDYLHSKAIVHRDLKPENLLFATKDSRVLKLGDFGLSKIIGEEAVLHTACGTPGYVAPEVLKCEGYGEKVDMWAVGVIMYILLCGFPPFYEENITALYEQILSANYDFPQEYWGSISDAAKDLISRLLKVDPRERYTAKQASNHPWIVGYAAKTTDMQVFDNMMKFNAKRKFKTAIATLVAKGRFAAGNNSNT